MLKGDVSVIEDGAEGDLVENPNDTSIQIDTSK